MSPATPPITTTTDGVSVHRHQPPLLQRPSSATSREDCWSEDETHALIEAWGSLHLSLNRGSLRQQQWSEVSAAVNSDITNRYRRRTDVQCKNRIDTLKKKYKIEKAKVAADDSYVSSWQFFDRLDFLIAGDKPAFSPAFPTPVISSFPVKRRSALPKRPARWLTEQSSDGESISGGGGWGREDEKEESGDGFNDGCRKLAEAIRRFGEVYERVESMKQEQLIELEKHRMQFAKDLEFQRMKLLMDTQVQLLSKIKRSKLNHPDVGEDRLLSSQLLVAHVSELFEGE